MSRLDDAVRACVRRHQVSVWTTILLRAGLWAAILAVAAWRLHRGLAASWWIDAALLATALTGLIGIGWWMRRRWVSPTAAVRELDDALKLQQRLITAAEFGTAPHPPALYPRLLTETVSRLSASHERLPRPVDRTTLAMATLLLLLLLWPLGPHAPIRLAHRSGEAPSPQPLDEPPTPPDERQQATQPDAQGDQQTARSPKEAQPNHGQQGGEDRPSASDQEQGPRESGHASDSSQPASGEGTAAEDEASGGGPSDQAGRQMAQQPAEDVDPSRDAEPKGSAPQEQGRAGAEDRRGQERQQAFQQSGRLARSGERPETSQASSQGGELGRMAGSHEALRAQIQELLKDLQQELHQMQQQLAAKTSEEPYPAAGTGTDPDLYGEAEDREPMMGAKLPIQLQTDNAPTSAQRAGGGVGEASGEVSQALPQMPVEVVPLTDQPTEETAGRRRAVPPTYQPVFERLYQRPATPEEGATP